MSFLDFPKKFLIFFNQHTVGRLPSAIPGITDSAFIVLFHLQLEDL